VTVNGASFNMARPFKSGREEIFRVSEWGGVYMVSSGYNFAVLYDGSFIEVLPMFGSNAAGQHCGACGNYDGNPFNDDHDKQGNAVDNIGEAWC